MNKTNDFLMLMLELIHFDEKHKIADFDYDRFSFKKLIEETLPETNRRSKILRNISFDEIFDFSFSYDGKSDFILTKSGVFKISDDSSLSRVEFKDEEENKKVCEILTKSNKNKSTTESSKSN